MYGIPHGWGANLLMYNTDVVSAGTRLLGRGVRRRAAVQGQGHRVRLAHLHRRRRAVPVKTKPDLGIKDPYSLTSEQLDAAVDLLKKQKANIGEYWSDYTKEVQAFESGDVGDRDHLAGDRQHDRRRRQGPRSRRSCPRRASTGWSDTWMLSSKATHPNCMYKWMDYIISPKVNAQVAEYFGEAPAQTKSCL